jgi:hypothetical protein
MIERSEVAQMAKFMQALDNPSETAASAGGAVGATDVAEMKAILERFYAAADHVVTEAVSDRELREALATEPTPNGARIGAWEIRAYQSGQHKLYDVVNGTTGQPLAAALLLYEAAHGLVRMLNNGGRINSPDAIELLRAEQEYGSRVHDMALFKHRLLRQPTDPRAGVFEARYLDAKRRATQARERVSRLAESHYA